METIIERSTHELCAQHDDVAAASLIENRIDETERRRSLGAGAGHRVPRVPGSRDREREWCGRRDLNPHEP